MSANYVDLSLMVDILIKAAYQACQIIHLSSLKHTNIIFKTQEDPVTQIDHTIQKSITELLQKHFPGIKIVGQQKIDEIMVDSLVLSTINNPQIEFVFMQHIHPEFNARLEDLTIFIDPLDCTRGYICGKKWECTVLIGVACKGVPVFGVIGHPYQPDQVFNKFQYNPRFIVGGSIFEKQLSYEYCEGSWSKITLKNNNNNVTKKVALSSRRKNKCQEDLIQNLSLSTVYCGGSGNKIAKMLRGQVDVVIFLQSPTSTWDSCAGQAIVVGMRGIFTKPNNTKIEYQFGKMDQTNYEGFICCLDQNLHKSIIECLQN